MEEKDAVIVGARCAGSTLALALAERGWEVALVDRATFPSDTLSTHMIYPNTVARLDQLGVLDRLLAAHDVPFLRSRMVGLGHEVRGTFTPIAGFDRAIAPRRIALDQVVVETALASGAQGHFGKKVTGLLGSGTEEDPVHGVMLEGGEEIRAKWVFGADGRGSTIAGRLGIEKERPQRGEIAFLFAYWTDLPDDGYATIDIHEDLVLSRWANEDGFHMLAAGVPAQAARGSAEERTRRYLHALRQFPESLPLEQLDAASMASEVIVAPESLMRGYFRRPTGPGWALVGDAAHFKHPGTAQGIGDAVEQAIYIGDKLSAGEGLDGYSEWIDRRAAEHYDWSFAWGRFPKPGVSDKLFAGWAGDPDVGQDLRDTFSRQVDPSRLMGKERLERWFADAPAAADS